MPEIQPPQVDPKTDDPRAEKSASLLQVAGAVFWSFFGVRKGTAMSRDVGTIKLHHVVIVGVVLAAILVFSLIALVRLITAG